MGGTGAPILKKQMEPTAVALDEDIKTAALEALVPSESLNRARLIPYEQVRSEIQAYIEARRSQFALDPMDVDSFGNGGKKGGK